MSDSPNLSNRSQLEMQSAFLARRMDAIAAGLESMAREVRRSSAMVARPLRDGDTYARWAGEVQHDILWGLANLHLDRLPSDAYDADVALAAERAVPSAEFEACGQDTPDGPCALRQFHPNGPGLPGLSGHMAAAS